MSQEQLPDINWQEYQLACAGEQAAKAIGVTCVCMLYPELEHIYQNCPFGGNNEAEL